MGCKMQKRNVAYILMIIIKIIMIIIFVPFSFELIFGSLSQPYETVVQNASIILIGLIPVLICHFLSKWVKKTTNIFVKICSILLSAFLLLILPIYALIGLFNCALICDDPPINPYNKSRYEVMLSKMPSAKERAKHFPHRIPKDAKDYYFLREWSFSGYNVHYLKFSTNENYINKIINDNKDKIVHKLNSNNVDDYYKFVPYRALSDSANCTIYILKNENNDNDYTPGIITSKSNEILFFYSNFDLKGNRY